MLHDPHARRERLERLLTSVAMAVLVAASLAAAASRLAARPGPVLHQAESIVVHVHGEVVVPGTYRLPWGSRVGDLVAAAGGLTADADPSLVAAAAALTDGRTVVVPSRRGPEGDPRVDLNTASERTLMSLPGVGPVTARRIVDSRPFHRVDDLVRVPGIGPARLERLRDRVRV